MSEAQQAHARTQAKLLAIATQYFTYLAHDPSLSPVERKKLLLEDGHIFLGFGKIYRDAETIAFVNEILRSSGESIPDVRSALVKRRELEVAVGESDPEIVTKREEFIVTGGRRSQGGRAFYSDGNAKIERRDYRTYRAYGNFVTSEHVLHSLSIDQRTLNQLSRQFRLKVEKKTVDGVERSGISRSDYYKIKRYVEERRPK
jgi:hypothetical protein